MKTKNKLKIAFIHPDLGIGGAERLVLDVASALTKQGHEVIFLTNHFDKFHAFEELKKGEFPVQVFGDWIPRNIFNKCQALCAYLRMIYLTIIYLLFFRKHDEPDLYFVDLIPIANPILKLAKEKVIYYCHHPDLLASPPGGKLKQLYRKPIDWLELKSTAKADIILVNSEYTASIFHETFPEITKPIQVLYPTVAYSYQETVGKLLQNSKPRAITEIVPEITSVRNFVFLSVNRFHPAKKLELAILALEKLQQIVSKELWSQIYLILAGGFDPQSMMNEIYFEKLMSITEQKNLQDKIIFLKSPSNDVKAELLLECHAVIYTPVNEHFGIVPLEAMTVNKPVLACNSGGPRETVEHGVTGYLCEPNPESMCQFMQLLLDKKTAIEMGLKGKARLDQLFSYASFSKRLKGVLKNDIFRKKKD